MTKARIGVGLIGTGYMGKCHAQAWNSVGLIFGEEIRPDLVHLADVDASIAQRKAKEFGFARSSDDWRQLIADPDVDIVSVTTPNQFHAEMAIAALEAGKHVWCEKPMAPNEPDAVRMLDAARKSGKIAALGYNYIQSPAIRHIEMLIRTSEIGSVNHVRVEMDEDYMADEDATFNWKNEKASGYGALDDFAVHPLSMLHVLLGLPHQVIASSSRPVKTRPSANGRRDIENHDLSSVLMQFDTELSGVLMVNRAAWGRKGRIALQIFGSKGMILFDQERANEFQLYRTQDTAGNAGFRTVLMGPLHPPYNYFVPAPGHGLGFNDLKVIEAHEILKAIGGDTSARLIDFETGLAIEKTVHAMARSANDGVWTRTGI